MNTLTQLTEEQFEAKYKPQINHILRKETPLTTADEDIASFGGCMYETFGLELAYVQAMDVQKRVITIIEGEDTEPDEDGETHSTLYYSSGYHFVNRIGYLILDKPYTENFEVKLDW